MIRNWARIIYEHLRDIGIAPPRDLMTDGGDGPNRRIRVDVGQTGFFAGREFRTFKEINISNTNTYVIKIVAPINFILQELTADVESGTLEISAWVGGTEGGTFSDELPAIGTNQMTVRPFPYYEPVLEITGGGTHTGGTQVRISRLRSSSDNGPIPSGPNADTQGLGPQTYYIRMTARTGNVTGIAQARWEERP